MSRNLFDVLPSRFFGVLMGPDQRFYADLLVTLHQESLLTEASMFNRDFVYETIQRCLDNYQQELQDTDDEEFADDTKTNAEVYRRLRNAGWLEEELDDTRNLLVRFRSETFPFLNAIRKLSHPSLVSLGGRRRIIEDAIESVPTSRHPFSDCLDVALEHLQAYVDDLGNITEMQRREQEDVLRSDSLEDAQKHLHSYLHKSLAGEYHEAQMDENLNSQTCARLLFKLDAIRGDEALMSRIIDNAQIVWSMDTLDQAAAAVELVFDKMRNILRTKIDEEHNRFRYLQSRYFNNCQLKMKMLSFDSGTNRSTVNRIIAHLDADDIDESDPPEWYAMLQDALSCPAAMWAGIDSLYTARQFAAVADERVETLPDKPDFQDERNASFQEIASKITAAKVSKKIRSRMGEKKELRFRDAEVSSMEDYNELLLMALFCGSSDSEFEVAEVDGRVEMNGFDFPNLVIRAKEEKKE